jgi:hypothetical protein
MDGILESRPDDDDDDDDLQIHTPGNTVLPYGRSAAAVLSISLLPDGFTKPRYSPRTRSDKRLLLLLL